MTARKHYFDSCRALLMFLGIPVHAAMAYQYGTPWMLASPDRSEVLTLVARWVHSFRMPAFFVIAGYFALYTLSRNGGVGWLRSRVMRLGVPFLTTALLFSPGQVFVSECARGLDGDVGRRTMLRLTGSGYDWVLHLWFLVDLLLMSAALAVAWAVRRHSVIVCARLWVASLSRNWRIAATLGLLAGFGVAGAAVAALGRSRFVFIGVFDAPRLASYAPFFVGGVALAHSPRLLGLFTKPRRVLWVVAAVTTGGMVFLDDGVGFASRLLRFSMMPIAGFSMAHVLLAAASRWFDSPRPIIRVAVDASFTVYLVHHPIVVLLAFAFMSVKAAPVIEFAAIIVIATALSLAAHRLVSSRPELLFLFNGAPRIRRAPAIPSASSLGACDPTSPVSQLGSHSLRS